MTKLRNVLSTKDFWNGYTDCTSVTDSRTFNVFILLNGWICLHGVLK